MFFSEKLKKFSNLEHCFFSRKHGISSGIYNSLNCGLGSHDKKANILENRKIVSDNIGCKKELLITLNQTHSTKVIYLEKKNLKKNELNGDAIITNLKNVGIGILTADCAPILFHDPKKKIIGCIHSGWKGALEGIIKNTLKKLLKLECRTEDLIFAIGPCISKKNYEVGEEFYKKFIKKNKQNDLFFESKKNAKYLFDLGEFIRKELINLGVKNIDSLKMDTFSNEESFFSYRRSSKRKEKDYGRCISVILMT